jgi:hypothetical protein
MGIRKGVIDLRPIESHKERAEILSRENNIKGVDLRELGEKNRKLTAELTAVRDEHSEHRAAQTRMARRVIWERQYGPSDYKECMVCDRGLSPFNFEVCHLTSFGRENPDIIKGRPSFSGADDPRLNDHPMFPACGECNKWHEDFCKLNPKATLHDVKRAYKAFQSGTPIYVLNSQPTQSPAYGGSDSDTEGIFDEDSGVRQKHSNHSTCRPTRRRDACRYTPPFRTSPLWTTTKPS